MAGPLEGVRVVEWAHYHMGPGAGLILADMGADVIHVEAPPPGDDMRSFETLWGYDFTLPGGRNAFTEDLNRNKRSLSLDLRNPESRRVLHDFVAEGDVFLTNMRQAAVTKLEMDYDTLRRVNPRLVYGIGSGYGARGPTKNSPGNEMMGLAHGGLMLGSAAQDGEPLYPAVGMNDRLGSIGLALGILGALVARERTGVGQLVHSSLLGWSVNLQAVGTQLAVNTGQDPRPPRRTEANDPLYNYYQTGDGVWVALGMVIHKERFWPQVCLALGAPALASDPRFASADQREANAPELIAIFDELFERLTFEEWDRVARERDFISSRVNTPADLSVDPQVLENNYLQPFAHPDLGTWTYVTTPLDYSETPVSIRRVAPMCGEHNEELAREWLGLSDDEVADLVARGVVSSGEAGNTS